MTSPSAALEAWLLNPATSELEAPTLLDGVVTHLVETGLSFYRVAVWIPTKHPELWGHQLVWEAATGTCTLRRSHDVSDSLDYVGTPAEALHQSGQATLRCRLDREPDRSRFAMLAAMAQDGATDYLIASLQPASARGAWISFATARVGGYTDPEVSLLCRHLALLSLHVQLNESRFATRSLLEVYLGANAARRVLDGEFRRGTGTEIEAALWFCDMRGFSAMSDRLPARAVVGILDRYFERVAAPIEELGGEILKFIGDAILAVFPITAGDAGEACRNALKAAKAVLERVEVDNTAGAEPEPFSLGIALHLGRVMYGNIGGRGRLDFTVIGASVNEVCRVEAMCKSLDKPLLMTATFAAALGDSTLVSLGQHKLKGVAQPQEILTVSE